jgi:hypothetical protein
LSGEFTSKTNQDCILYKIKVNKERINEVSEITELCVIDKLKIGADYFAISQKMKLLKGNETQEIYVFFAEIIDSSFIIIDRNTIRMEEFEGVPMSIEECTDGKCINRNRFYGISLKTIETKINLNK